MANVTRDAGGRYVKYAPQKGEFHGDEYHVDLGENRTLIVDACFAPLVIPYRWIVHPGGAVFCNPPKRDHPAQPGKKLVLIHRVVLNAPDGVEVDHQNRNPLDNRLANLRPCGRAESNWNSPRRANNTSGFKGVNFNKESGKWVARIMCHRKSHYLGRYDTPEDAHRAYCEGAIRLHGEFARFE